MAFQIGVGRENFDEIRKDGSYYVDKTELIYDLVHNTDNAVSLFSRPRRFGKTLNLSMLESFFDINRDSRAVFEGLDITKHADFCAEWMNQYPVLSFSLKGVEDLSFEDAYGTLLVKIADICKRYEYLYTSERTDEADRRIFQRLRYGEAPLAEVKNFAKTLSRMMNAAYGKPVVLLIDEYDVPLAKASENEAYDPGYYTKMLSVVRGIFEAALKTNDYLKFAVVTGCLRIAKESIFTGTNNFASYTVLEDRFSRYFGFTREEVDKLLLAADLGEKADVFKAWYDGYIFGDTPVYCPWDVVNYVSALLRNKDAEPKNYWRNTSGNGVIRDFVNHSDWGIPDKFEILMNGGTVTQNISDELTYDRLHESEENLWSILLMTGYLTKADPNGRGRQVELRIPNAEIAGIFEDAVVNLFTDTIDTGRQQELMRLLWAGEADKAADALSCFLWDTISYHDYHEDYYHAFLAGLFVGLGYAVDSNRESGLGRFDVRVKDRRNRRVMIIEAKKSETQAGMEADCEKALRQIAEKQYVKSIDPGYREILCYGIAFFRKTAMIRKL